MNKIYNICEYYSNKEWLDEFRKWRFGFFEEKVIFTYDTKTRNSVIPVRWYSCHLNGTASCHLSSTRAVVLEECYTAVIINSETWKWIVWEIFIVSIWIEAIPSLIVVVFININTTLGSNWSNKSEEFHLRIYFLFYYYNFFN